VLALCTGAGEGFEASCDPMIALGKVYLVCGFAWSDVDQLLRAACDHLGESILQLFGLPAFSKCRRTARVVATVFQYADVQLSRVHWLLHKPPCDAFEQGCADGFAEIWLILTWQDS
jgi:hypothetical protein